MPIAPILETSPSTSCNGCGLEVKNPCPDCSRASALSGAQQLLNLDVRLQLANEVGLTLLELLQVLELLEEHGRDVDLELIRRLPRLELDLDHLESEEIPITQRDVDRLLTVQRRESTIDRGEAGLVDVEADVEHLGAQAAQSRAPRFVLRQVLLHQC